MDKLIIENFLSFLAFGFFIISFGNARWAIPILEILNRWFKWILFSVGFAYIAVQLEWSYRSFELLAITAFLVWLLIETIYNWLAVNLLSKSDIPLFPRFFENTDKDEWPNTKSFIQIREWLREQNFKAVQHLKANVSQDLFLRSSFYENEEHNIRIQVLILPQRIGYLKSSFVLSSFTETGKKIITDNISIPYGGFFPEAWNVKRSPLTISLKTLYKTHQKRIYKEDLKLWENVPLVDLNEQQQTLEKINTEKGFINPRSEHKTKGKITQEGCYRLWKELWLINYLGKTMTGK